MYMLVALLTKFAAQGIGYLFSKRSFLGVWLVGLAVTLSFLGNISYSIRNENMVGSYKESGVEVSSFGQCRWR